MVQATPELPTSQQPYVPAPSRIALSRPSPAPLPDRSLTVVASHDSASGSSWSCACHCCPGCRGLVEAEEWWAEPQPCAAHEPPYAAYYPRTNPDNRRFFGCRPGESVSAFYPPAFDAAPQRHYPTREQYAAVVASYNAAIERAFHATPPDPLWLTALVSVTLVASPYFIWREWRRQQVALQAMRQQVVRTLRDANAQLDADWRQRPVETGQDSSRRWQWRWIGRYVNQKSYKERPQLALVHIASI